LLLCLGTSSLSLFWQSYVLVLARLAVYILLKCSSAMTAAQ